MLEIKLTPDRYYAELKFLCCCFETLPITCADKQLYWFDHKASYLVWEETIGILLRGER